HHLENNGRWYGYITPSAITVFDFAVDKLKVNMLLAAEKNRPKIAVVVLARS
ncbi:MAG: hypothetical protein FD159_2602, partial [Syntrophaceae bacterium]